MLCNNEIKLFHNSKSKFYTPIHLVALLCLQYITVIATVSLVIIAHQLFAFCEVTNESVTQFSTIRVCMAHKVSVKECVERFRRGGVSIRQVAREFGVSEATVRYNLQAGARDRTSPGTLSSLPSWLKAEIAAVAKEAAAHGFGLSLKELTLFIGDLVKRKWNDEDQTGEYLRKYCRFTNFTPGQDFMARFMTEYHLSLVKPSPIERTRAAAASDPFLIYEFYELLEKCVVRLGLQDKPSHLWNGDESCFITDPSRVKVVAETGAGSTKRITSGPGRTSYSVMACVSASGAVLPPMIIFPGKFCCDYSIIIADVQSFLSWPILINIVGKYFLANWKGNEGCNALYAKSEKGWMTSEVFLQWFRQFLRLVPQRPLILIIDGHQTHLGLDVIHEAKLNDVTLLKLPAHTTDRLQVSWVS
jgi:transposase-like protein